MLERLRAVGVAATLNYTIGPRLIYRWENGARTRVVRVRSRRYGRNSFRSSVFLDSARERGAFPDAGTARHAQFRTTVNDTVQAFF